jgi:APA family basic amino acid/polyamine antiporter
MSAASQDRAFGVWTATALVVGGMIGAGIFVLPAQLAPYGWWSVGAWVAAILGSLALALVFVALHRAYPRAGGAVALVETGLGPLPGMLVGWSYWLSIVATNAVMALAAASYAGVILPALAADDRAGGLFAVLLIVLLTALNILGTRAAGRFQIVATIAKLIPLVVASGLLVAVFARGEPPQALATDLGEASLFAPLTAAMFALLGFEAASVAAARVRDPARNVARATIGGLLVAGGLYMLLSTGIALALPAGELAASPAPFALLFDRFATSGSAAAVAACAVLAAVGALNGWVLLQGEVPRTMALTGALPAWFARSNAAGVPVGTMLLSSALACLLVLTQLGEGLAKVLEFTITLTTAVSLWLYLAIAITALRLRIAIVPAAIGLVFTLAVMWGTGWGISLLSLALMLSGLPFYRKPAPHNN